MKICKYKNEGNDRLLLFFNGWSASPRLFTRIEPETDMDYWVAYDYRGGFELDESIFFYKEVTVIAWSLGVFVATFSLIGHRLPIVRAIAVNGTLFPVDNRWGIPCNVFWGTLKNLNAEAMRRFNRRMCGNQLVLQHYSQLPAYPLDEIREELKSLSTVVTTDCSCSPFWTEAIISTEDCIFPPQNMRTYWEGRCAIREIKAPHYPFYLWERWSELWK